MKLPIWLARWWSSAIPKEQPPKPWWLDCYENAPLNTLFGPGQRRELDGLLKKLKIDAGSTPSYTALHGYVTAQVIGPQRNKPARWLPHLLGADLLEAPSPDAQRLIALIRRLFAHIHNDFLREEPHRRIPALGVGQGPPTKTEGPMLFGLREWCTSVLHGMQVQSQRWAKLGEPDDPNSPLHVFWCNTAEGREQMEDDTYRYFREDGHDERQARLITERFMVLPSNRRDMIVALRRVLLDINRYWKAPWRIK